MDETIILFDDCFSKKKDLVACQPSRFHYTDIRFFFETESQLNGYDLFDTLSKVSIVNLGRYYTPKEISDITNFVDYLKDVNSLVHKRIKKQIKNIEDSNIRKIIKDLYTENCVGKLKDINLPTQDDSKEEIAKFIRDYVPITFNDDWMCLMDYYLISRCFRSYDKKKGYSRPSYNNIIQAGNHHVRNYLVILQKLGFTVKYKNVNVDKNDKQIRSKFQCINIEKMKQPMFHQRYK